jgi:polysaccharide export outer membrane protein
MKRNILWIFALAVCLTQIAFAQQPSVPVNPRGYLIGPGDVIEGKVLGERDFDFNATIDEDGNFEVPFFDKPVAAVCRTEKELRIEVTKLVSKYVRNPQVSVQVKERKSRPPATIYGEVRQQQQVILTRKARLLELLSFAGGVTEKAGGMIQIFRTQPLLCADPNEVDIWKTEAANGLDVPSRVYSLASVRQGKDESNPVIYPGDIVVVQKAAPVYIVGEILRPGEMTIPEGGLPLMQAIAMASGISREAKTKNIKIYRRKEGSINPEVINVNYDSIKKGEQKDVILEPFDIVEVGKSKKKFSDYLLDFVIGLPNRIPIVPL